MAEDEGDILELEKRGHFSFGLTLVFFMRKFGYLGEPLLGLFSQGTLSAGWRIADNKHLLIEFLERDFASFAMISPDETAPDKKFRLNGRGTCQQIIDTLRSKGVDKWKIGNGCWNWQILSSPKT